MQWAVSNIPGEYTHKLPDYYPDTDWSAAMNLGHLVIYEESVSAPTLTAMATGGILVGPGSPFTPAESWFYDDSVALSAKPFPELAARLAAARERTIAQVREFPADELNNRMDTVFGRTPVHGRVPHSPGWVAMKTVQHTWEHGNALLRLALFSPRA